MISIFSKLKKTNMQHAVLQDDKLVESVMYKTYPHSASEAAHLESYATLAPHGRLFSLRHFFSGMGGSFSGTHPQGPDYVDQALQTRQTVTPAIFR
ncbi:hypothetical protein SAY87_015316 [Trapa incisa]|uniref:Uncharacterized protein n=1 Tax=Trapa incisa TaxID=236973 RepID=A0AAN7GLH6_9MYRT|nr:hypothetical protein SAY87_015316 [Trapa incisa]